MRGKTQVSLVARLVKLDEEGLMANVTKAAFLEELTKRYGNVHKLPRSLSLYDLGDDAGRIYIRYSKVHSQDRTFYGLRKKDLQQLEGRASAICFLWDGQAEMNPDYDETGVLPLKMCTRQGSRHRP